MERRNSYLSDLCHCVGPDTKPRRDCCLDISDKIVHRPDPTIYSQEEELGVGRPTSWNSPDITTNDWGPFRLRDTITAQISNRTDKVNAANTLVHCYLSPFGIGMPFAPYASHRISIPAGGTTDLEFALDASLRENDAQRLGATGTSRFP